MVRRHMGEGDIGLCPICGRLMIAGPSVDEHHWVPKSEGGRETAYVHRICHRALHALFTERQLAVALATPEAVRSDPSMAKFIRWVRRRPPEYVDWPKNSRG